ncbi:MAG TPA: glycosyltransferase family 9 protein [Acidimicrobiales bacterium]|nr:glycosyltransferase family 9 protein [Acidimicrobiales bacterium]
MTSGRETSVPTVADRLAPGRAMPPPPALLRLRPVADLADDVTPTTDGIFDLDHIERIAVLRALPGVGDMVCAVPALRALRRRFPRAGIALIGLWSSQWMLDAYPHYVDELLPVDGLPMLCPPPVDIDGALSALAAARQQRFDLAVQLHGDGSLSNLVTTLLGATRNLVHHLPDNPPPDGALGVPYAGRGHEVVRLLELVEHVGAVGDAQLEPPVWEAQARGRALVASLPAAGGGLAVLHPGASHPRRRWPAAGFAAVARWLLERDIAVVATGTASEQGVVADLCRREPGVIDLCGRTSVCDMAGVLSGARLVVSNDTGVAHLAAAVRAPSVVTFLGDDPGRWAPLDSVRHHVVLLGHSPGDRPGAGEAGPVLDDEQVPRGLHDGELAAVLGAVADQLTNFPPPPA